MVRVFIAIELPQKVREELAQLGQYFSLKKTKWVKEENLHLTLKFLGNLAEEKVEVIEKALKEKISSFPSFSFFTGDFGAFPTPKRARVIWVGVEKGAEKVSGLAELVDQALTRLGLDLEKRQFHPHITLARLKIPQAVGQWPKRLPSYGVPVNEVVIFASYLSPQGPTYEPLARVPLLGK
jgi:2'-5' RNA ligase